MTGQKLIFFVIVIGFALKQVYSYTESCIGEFCFTTPDSSELKNFDGAKSWCTDHQSALAVVNDSDVQLALTQFLSSSTASAMAFINMKLYQRNHTWFLVNGSIYNGQIRNQGVSDYKLYCNLKSFGNIFEVNALQPNESNHYICEFQDTRCLNNSANSIVYQGRCYMKFEDETLTWYQARERCINNSGDLASFQTNPPLSFIPPFETTWLNPSFAYWLGIRWSDRRWNSPDGGKEAIYTWWSIGKPNNYNYQCVCVDPTGNPAWSWTDCDCNGIRKFVCLKIVPTTTTSPTTTTTTTRFSSISPISDVIPGANSISTTNVEVGVAIGLGIGIPLIVVIAFLAVVVAILMKQLSRAHRSLETYKKQQPVNVDTHEFSDKTLTSYESLQPIQESEATSNVLYQTIDPSTKN